MRNFQGMILNWIRTYREIFKSACGTFNRPRISKLFHYKPEILIDFN